MALNLRMDFSQSYRKVDGYIDQCVESPDGMRILYSEVCAWGEGAPTDDEDYYYKVLDLRDMSLVTIYKCPMRRYKLYWR